MADVVVTVPMRLWQEWLDEGDLPGEPPAHDEYAFCLWGGRPQIVRGERVYIVAHGKLRGYAPLTRIGPGYDGGFALYRAGGAVACTIAEPIRGFRGWRYRWWPLDDERPFPDWRTPSNPKRTLTSISRTDAATIAELTVEERTLHRIYQRALEDWLDKRDELKDARMLAENATELQREVANAESRVA